SFEQLITETLAFEVARLAAHSDRLVDSMPISLAKWPRSGVARVARGVADEGYSASKRSYYFGDGQACVVVALRLIGQTALRESLRLADSKNRHSERFAGAFDQRVV